VPQPSQCLPRHSFVEVRPHKPGIHDNIVRSGTYRVWLNKSVPMFNWIKQGFVYCS